MRTRGGGAGGSLLIGGAITLYLFVLGFGALDHHDVACHLKSRTHCTTCVSAAVPGLETGESSGVVVLSPAAAMVGERCTADLGGAVAPPDGRAPPAA